ncbi:CSC1-like protein ERD4 [Impatiens glandulifera]|uniref:CSC1-like protein ERD4 n=1 Tax=Impatiens glandulifera TaxID=253017 RepID=UPI001FB12DDB|nr:CSC1-like protein ERD4 [Impatiens glandulifera]
MDFSSFLTSLGTSFVIFVILMCLFSWLSSKPGNSVVYYPNRILKGLEPWEGGTNGSRRTRNPLAWIREALSSTEQDVISMSGVDSAVYFVFLTTALGIFVLSGVIMLPVLLPLAATDKMLNSSKSTNTTSAGTFNELDKLSMGHVGEESPRLWAYVIAEYWVSLLTYYLLWKAYKHVSALRASALKSPELRPHQFAILVRDIPKSSQTQTIKEHVDSYFTAIYPDTFYRSMVVTNNKQVNAIWEEIQSYKKKLDRVQTVYAAADKTTATRPKIKTGFLGLFGETVDTIDYYTLKINELTPKLEEERKLTLREKQQASAIVFFKNRVTAAAAAQSLHATMVDTWTVMEAPEARQLIWTNLNKKYYERQVRHYLVCVLVALMVFFYMIPIGFVSALTSLANLEKYLPFLKPIVEITSIKTVLEAYLPQLALIVFLALLPKLLLSLSKAEGLPSESHAARAASGKYFCFTVFNVFIGVTIASTLFETFKDIQKNPNLGYVANLLAESLPGKATFFLTFVALKFFVGYGLELSRIVPLIMYHLKKKYLCKTEAEIKEAWAPGDIGYVSRIPGDMLILTIVLCYSIIAPIIIPFGALYFGLGWLILRNQVLKVYVPSYESYGRMWPHIHARILASLLLYQMTMFGYFSLKKFVGAVILIPLPVMTVIFALICRSKFYGFFKDPALEVVASKELKETSNPEVIFKSFIPPSLAVSDDDDKVPDEDQFEDALSQVSRSVSFA